MDTYFARHTHILDVDTETRARLWAEDRVAIHYPEGKDGVGPEDNESLEPPDYPPKAAQVVRALRRLAEEGGYVCAEHWGQPEGLVGFVAPGTQIEILKGRWRTDQYGAGRTAVLKSIRLTKVRRIPPLELVAVLAGRPRQGTLMRWWQAGNRIRCLVERTPLPAVVDSLSSAQQEVMCAELLRLPVASELGLPRLRALLLPIGRTLRDLDLYGTAEDGLPLVAQVTYHALGEGEAQDKLARLNLYGESRAVHRVLFCRTERREEFGGTTIFPLEAAFNHFRSTPLGREWVNHVLGHAVGEVAQQPLLRSETWSSRKCTPSN